MVWLVIFFDKCTAVFVMELRHAAYKFSVYVGTSSVFSVRQHIPGHTA